MYTDTIDLSLYNSVIIRKANLTITRALFSQYPNRVNNAGDIYQHTWEQIGDTDIYVADISGQTGNDLRFYIDAYNGDNSGNIYYISFNTKSVSEIKSNYSFVE